MNDNNTTSPDTPGRDTRDSSGTGDYATSDMQEWERLLLSISTELNRVDSETLNTELNNTLALIGKHSGADRAYIFLYEAHQDSMSNTHEWCNKGVLQQREHLQDIPASAWPYWISVMRDTGIVNWESTEYLPDATEAEKSALREQGIQSVVAALLTDENGMQGFVGFDSVRMIRLWKSQELYLLQLIANIISSSIVRLQHYKLLRETGERLGHAAKMGAPGRFVGGVAHDFNNLLTVILSICGIYEDEKSLVCTQPCIDQIRTAAADSARLTKELLAFGRSQSKAKCFQ